MYAVFDEIEQLSRVISLRMLNADFKFVFHFGRFEHPIPEYSDDFFFSKITSKLSIQPD